MRYLPVSSREECDSAIDRMMVVQTEHGYCFWALEHKADRRFLGFCGLLPPRPPLVEIEIGWRLASDVWGQGYAREAAEASLSWAWRSLEVPSIAAITVPANERSWGLMQRLGMAYVEGGDFDHPDLPESDPLRRHVLYRISRPQ